LGAARGPKSVVNPARHVALAASTRHPPSVWVADVVVRLGTHLAPIFTGRRTRFRASVGPHIAGRDSATAGMPSPLGLLPMGFPRSPLPQLRPDLSQEGKQQTT